MHALDHNFYKLFEECEKRAKETYKPKAQVEKDKRTARASSLNNALNNIENQLRGIH